MIGKLKYQKKIEYFLSRFSDIRFIGQVIFVVVVLLISWSGVKSIQTNYDLQKQITALKQQNELQQLQDENQKLQNQYYQTNQYLDIAARQNLGLGVSGEKELLVPTQVAWSYTVNIPSLDQAPKATVKRSSIQSNFDSWVNFFLHRTNSM
ncbi:MAG TPA: septum formation initiator family protein [Candidatus Saccharimonadales bacterium]|nr:septum formation initiator family protein [Candidatus Saccharimonadales bacterium]